MRWRKLCTALCTAIATLKFIYLICINENKCATSEILYSVYKKYSFNKVSNCGHNLNIFSFYRSKSVIFHARKNGLRVWMTGKGFYKLLTWG